MVKTMPNNTIEITRKTKETDITLKLKLNSQAPAIEIDTGIGFFDHMLTALALHGKMDLTLLCKGDLEVDSHHTIEDCGIALGQAFAQATADKTGLTRYGSAFIPMDEALAFACVDISNRPYLVFDCDFKYEKIGQLDSQMVVEFFRAFAYNGLITLHIRLEYGENDHHKAEGVFKAVAHCLRIATTRVDGQLLSTKGVL